LLWLLAVPLKVVMVKAPELRTRFAPSIGREEHTVNNIVWWVGAIVIILAILGFLGFR
jgi:hypothetical protein